MVGEPIVYKDALLPCVLILVLCSSRREQDLGSKFLQIDLTDVVTATSSPAASNWQHSEGKLDSEVTSELECSGICHVSGEDVAVCRSSEPSEAVTAAGSTNSESGISAVNVSLQQSEIAVSEMADSAAHDADASCASISDLPDEILVQIFSHLSFSDLVDVVQKVCSRWKRVSHDLDLWTDKEVEIMWTDKEVEIKSRIYNSHTIKTCVTDQEAIQTFCDVPGLRKVTMHRTPAPRVFDALCNGCPRLSELRLRGKQLLRYSELKNLVEKCSGIHMLEISKDQLKTEKFSELVSRLQHLRVLELYTECIPQTYFVVLKPLGDGCPRLEDVNLRHVKFDVDDLRYFLNAKRNTLKSIHIRWTMVEERCVLPLLVVCADTLERLELTGYYVYAEAMQAFTALGRLKNLRELKMDFNNQPPPGAAARAFNTGVGLPHLTLLHLPDGYGLDDDTMLAICHGCPALRELLIRRAYWLTDAAFSQMYCLERLEKLEISCCQGLGGALIPYLARLPRLLTLVFAHMEFPKLQPGLSSILEFSGLHCLTLEYSLVTGVPFDKFPEKLVSLRELNYVWCLGDPEVADGLVKLMPSVKGTQSEKLPRKKSLLKRANFRFTF